MAHKKKNKLNKMLKAQQLQQISIGQISPNLATAPALATPASAVAPAAVIRPVDRHLSREIFRTLISLLVVAALLVVAVIVDHRTNYLTNFGAWLFKALRLASK